MSHINLNSSVVLNSSITEAVEMVSPDDATWILTSAFIIFTMQSGFGLVESGLVSSKNETNIMVKNVIDVVYGGFSYWLFGFAFSFGVGPGTNPFCGVGYFATDVAPEQGDVFATYFFQMSFATTATTIVSGAMAERTNLNAYTVFSFTNTVSYCFPAHWVWGKDGFLSTMGVIDIAGCSAVHLVGGAAGLVAAIMLGPRTGKYDKKQQMESCSHTNVMLGTFMLWWGWLGFNCGSTFGITGAKWLLASRSAVVTLNGSIGGGMFGIIYSYATRKRRLDVATFITGILGGLVGITAICAVARPWEGFLIGFIGAAVACGSVDLFDKLKVDDPVGCIGTHGTAGIWGMIAVGLFVEEDNLEGFSHTKGLFKGGGIKLLGVQILACVVISTWSAFVTWAQLFIIGKFIPIRLTVEEEMMGADRLEHGIYDTEDEEEENKPSASDDNGNVVDSVDDGKPGYQSYWAVALRKESESQFSKEMLTLSVESLRGALNYGYENDTTNSLVFSDSENEKGVQCNLEK